MAAANSRKVQYFFEGKDFGLLGLEKDDFISCMTDWCNDDEVTHYMVTGLYPGNREQLDEIYSGVVSGENVVFAIKNKKSGKTVGFAGLYDIKNQPRFAEYRIIIGDKASWGKGIGTGVAAFIVRYAFEYLNLNKVWLGVNAESKRALTSYEKAGFVKEGVLREEVWRNNRYYDIIRMSYLSSDYGK